MGVFVMCSLRRVILRSLLTAMLWFGLCRATRVSKAVYYELPHDPIHWNRHLTMVRSLLGSQQLGLKYSPLGGASGSPGRATEERFASTEDFFGAEEFKRPATMPESTWCDLTRIIFTTIFGSREPNRD